MFSGVGVCWVSMCWRAQTLAIVLLRLGANEKGGGNPPKSQAAGAAKIIPSITIKRSFSAVQWVSVEVGGFQRKSSKFWWVSGDFR